jgi:hypothetical protein
MFGKYDNWRNHPSLRYTGVRDLRHVLPGFGTAAAIFLTFWIGGKVFGSRDNDAHGHHGHKQIGH